MNDSHQNSSFLSPQTIEFTRWAAVSSLLGLILVGLAWELWLAPLRPGGSWWAIKVLPLCWPLAGLLKNRMYTYRWVSLLVWLYFIEGVVRAWGDKGWSAGLASAQTALCIILFAACALHVRWRFQMAKANPVSESITETLSESLPETSSGPSNASEPKA